MFLVNIFSGFSLVAFSDIQKKTYAEKFLDIPSRKNKLYNNFLNTLPCEKRNKLITLPQKEQELLFDTFNSAHTKTKDTFPWTKKTVDIIKSMALELITPTLTLAIMYSGYKNLLLQSLLHNYPHNFIGSSFLKLS